jgi:oligoribonuclease
MTTAEPATARGARFIGLDLETTGLHEEALPLEIGMIAYDDMLTEIDTFHALILPGALDTLYTRCAAGARDMHRRNGLWSDLNELSGADEDDAAIGAVGRRAASWVDRHTTDEPPYMLGTNISYDRAVLDRTMPELLARFHYQSVDANSFKLIARHRYDALPPAGHFHPAHRVLPDVRGSVALIGDSIAGIVAHSGKEASA